MLFGVSAALRWIGWHVIVFNFFGFLIFDPVGLRELYFFFVVIFFGRQHRLLWFVVVCSFVGFRAFHGLFRIFSEIFLWRV